ncbi:MAG: TonB-dependent receptor [Pyrinomonadaceae bacterium]
MSPSITSGLRLGRSAEFRFAVIEHFALRPVLLLVAILALGLSGLGQSPVSGSFAGVVIEQATGTKISGALVTFRNQDTGSQTTAISGPDGQFLKTSLAPGFYAIEVRAEGFLPETKIQRLLATRENSVVPVPFEMIRPVATATPTPLPTSTPTALAEFNPTTTDEDQTIIVNPRRDGAFDARSIRSLPLGGTTLTRTFDELAFLIPGVYAPPQAVGSSVGPGIGSGVGTSGQFAVNGLRSRANNFTVDGSDNNDEDIGVRRQGFFSLVPQPIESIQEFQIITLLAPAEFGRNLGAQVNALSRSGSNRFSGTLYGLGNADFLNARNFFDNTDGNSTFLLSGRRLDDGVSIPVFRDGERVEVRNDAGEKDTFSLLQGGFAVGGPVVRDRLFFFASGEGQTMNGFKERHFAVPTLEERGIFGSGAQGFLAAGANGTVVPIFPTSTAADAAYSLIPFPNHPDGVYGANTYSKELSTDARGIILSGKLDYNLFADSERPQLLTARYNFTKDRRDLTDVGGALFSAIRPKVRTDNFSTYLTGALSENVSNEFRFSFGRTRLNFDELRDDFMLPLTSLSEGEDGRFVLNAPYYVNGTIAQCPNGAPQCLPSEVILPSRVDLATVPLFGGVAPTEYANLGTVGQLIIGGFSPLGVDVFNFPQDRKNNTLQFADTLRWQVRGGGLHDFAFGTDIRRTVLDSLLPRNQRSLVTFYGGQCTNPQTFCPRTAGFAEPLNFVASGAATGFFQSLKHAGTTDDISLSYYQLDFFAQDNWRPTQNLTLNFGLRYELNTSPKEADRKIEDTFPTTLPSYLSGLGQFIGGRTDIFDTDRNNFAPRFGIAYAPTDRTVIRGGFGVYFDQILGAVVSQSRNVFPTYTNVNFGGGLLADNTVGAGAGQQSSIFTMFNPRFAIFDPATGFVCNYYDMLQGTAVPCREPGAGSIFLIQPGTLNTINPELSDQQIEAIFEDIFSLFPAGSLFGTTLPTRKLDTPLSYQYSIGFEHRLFGETFFSAAYVGTEGRNLLRFTTPNLGGNFVSRIEGFFYDEGGCVNGITLCEPLTVGTTSGFAPRPVANAGAISQFETTGRSRYHSLQTELRGRLSRNFSYRAAYVFGKVKDDVSDVFDLAGAFALPQDSRTFEGEYAAANFDVRHRFAYNVVFDTPELRGHSGITRALFGEWQIAGTGRFSTGQPFTVNSIIDINQDGNLTDRLNNLRYLTETGDREQPLTLASDAVFREMLAPFGQNGAIPRNTFRGGSILELDLSFNKRFRFRETQDVRVRVDIFNFIDRANFGLPVRFLEAAGFGRATETLTPGRRIQLGLQYNF